MRPDRFGIAPHQKPQMDNTIEELVLKHVEFEDNAKEVLTQTDEIVKLAQPGDYFEIRWSWFHGLYIRNLELKIYYQK